MKLYNQNNVISVFLLVILFGCTQAVKHDSLVNEKKFVLDCMSVMPIEGDKNDLDIRSNLRKAVHSQLSLSGIKLTPMQKVDSLLELSSKEPNHKIGMSNFAKSTDCKYVLTGRLLNQSDTNLVIVTDFRLSAKFQIDDVIANQTLWTASHDISSTNGGLPLDPVSAANATYSAQANHTEDKKDMIIYDFAKKVVMTIPNLKYSPITSDQYRDQVTTSIVELSTDAEIQIQNDPEFEVKSLVAKLDKTPKSDFKGRLNYLRELRVLRPNDHWLLYENARLNYLLGNYKEAEQDINNAIHILEKNKKIDKAYLYLASRIAKARDDHLTSLHLLEKMSDLNMGLIFDYELIDLYINFKNYKKAYSLINKVLKNTELDESLEIKKFVCQANMNLKYEASKSAVNLLKKAIVDRNTLLAFKVLDISTSHNLEKYINDYELLKLQAESINQW